MKSGDADYEVDPARLSDSSKLEQNRKNLLELVTLFYKTIQKSLPSLPLQLRTVCHVLYSVSHVIVMYSTRKSCECTTFRIT